MTIFDDINNAPTVEALSTLYKSEYAFVIGLKQSIQDDEATRSALSDKITTESATLKQYGDLKELRGLFWTRLGELHKSELTS